MSKRIVSVLLSILLIVLATSGIAAKRVNGSDLSVPSGGIDDFDYEIVKNNIQLKRYKGTGSELVFEPSYEVDGKKYKTDLSDFMIGIGNRSVNSVFIPEGITALQDSIFNSTDVKRIFLPRSLKVISRRMLGYLEPDSGEKIEIYYGGKQKEFEKKLTDKSGNVGDDKWEQKGAELANKINNFFGGGYDPDNYVFIFDATKEDFLGSKAGSDNSPEEMVSNDTSTVVAASAVEADRNETANSSQISDDYQKALDELKDLKVKYEQLEKEIIDLNAEISSLKTEKEEAQSKVSDLESQIATAQDDAKDIKALENQLSDLEKKNASLTNENDSLVKDNASLVKENASLTRENASLTREKTSLSKENDSLREERDLLKETNIALEKENSKLNNVLSEMEKSRTEAESKASIVEPEKTVGDYSRLDNPTAEFIVSRLATIDDVGYIEAATEDNDPNGKLGKRGGYTAAVFFTSPLVDPSYSSMKQGKMKTGEGGCIEVYESVEDAQKRDDYLAGFDGSALDSGSHIVVGTTVIRTSHKLPASKQKKLEQEILEALSK